MLLAFGFGAGVALAVLLVEVFAFWARARVDFGLRCAAFAGFDDERVEVLPLNFDIDPVANENVMSDVTLIASIAKSGENRLLRHLSTIMVTNFELCVIQTSLAP